MIQKHKVQEHKFKQQYSDFPKHNETQHPQGKWDPGLNVAPEPSAKIPTCSVETLEYADPAVFGNGPRTLTSWLKRAYTATSQDYSIEPENPSFVVGKTAGRWSRTPLSTRSHPNRTSKTQNRVSKLWETVNRLTHCGREGDPKCCGEEDDARPLRETLNV